MTEEKSRGGDAQSAGRYARLLDVAKRCVESYPVASGRAIVEDRDGYGWLRELRLAVDEIETSAPAFQAPQNTAERPPSSDAAEAGADTRSSAGRETELLATLVYEAMRFAIWAAGQGIMPDEGEPAQGPEDFLYEYSCALEIDDWEGLAEVARDHVRAVPPKMLVDADWLRRKVETDPDMDADVLPELPQGSAETEWPDVAEDDPDVIVAARAIAEHGIGRPWDDFLPTNAYDVDRSDLIEYGRAAVAALRSRAEPQTVPNRENLRPFAEWADRNRSAVSHEAADELILLARKACDAYGPLSRPNQG